MLLSFLDAKNYVDSDFLSNINYYLAKYDVINPMVNYLPEKETFIFLAERKIRLFKILFKIYSENKDKVRIN